MQTSTAPDVKHPLPLAKSTLSVAAQHRRPSLGYLFAPLNIKTPETSTPSTNRLILDYLLFISIQSRLRQADIGILHNEQEEDEVLKRWTEAGIRANKDHIAVESIIHGVKSSSQSKIPLQFDTDLKQRLHLCQLTNFVFGRFDSTIVPATANNSTRQRKHVEQLSVSLKDDMSPPSELMNRRQHMFASPISPVFCRRHRNQPCMSCRSKMSFMNHQKVEGRAGTIIHSGERTSRRRVTLPGPPSAGLIDAIPSFLKTSASMLRRTLDRSEDSAEPLIVAGEKVIGGGMPAKWYDLFLELLTQAAIESYLCDGCQGLEFIFEIFSYGDVDEDGNDDEEDDGDDDGDDDDDENEEDWLSVKAADHHLLFPKTRTIYLFAKKLREREQEFLDVKDDLRSHFESLAEKYNLTAFEGRMREFIDIAHQSMDQPAMNKYERTEATESTKSSSNLPRTSPNMPVASLQASTVAPSLLEFPSDGSLLMPEVPDSDEEDVENDSEKDDVRSPSPKKRKSSAPTNTASKRTRRTRQSSNPTVNTKIPRKRPRSPVATQPSSAHKRKQ